MTGPIPPVAVRNAAVLVIGSGLAGLTVALQCAATGIPGPIVLVTKTAGLAGGSSVHAQGGIAAALAPGDRPAAHGADTIAAGAGLVDPGMADLLAREGAEQVGALAAAGLPFDRAADGALLFGREAAHGAARIVHAGGDATGRTLIAALAAQVLSTPAISVETGVLAVDLVVRRNRVSGVLAHGPDGWIVYRAPRVVLATGGIGAAFARTTNPPEATGDGLALAARAGAPLADLEFVQFHPTALAEPGGGCAGAGELRPAPLLTEALRGAGAVLVDAAGRRFMLALHPLAELAPRDVVARAIGRLIAAGQPVFLDLRPALRQRPEGFPTVVALCRDAGFDPWTAPVPVGPAAHYHMGGVWTDADGRTGLEGLWACGEVACTGVHGANRLASNSLLEALVFGNRVARALLVNAGTVPAFPLPVPPQVPREADAAQIAGLVAAARTILSDAAGLVRQGPGLQAAQRDLDRIAAALARLPTAVATETGAVRRYYEALNIVLVGRLVVDAALAREESRGAHYRADFPDPGPAAERHLFTFNPASGFVPCHTP